MVLLGKMGSWLRMLRRNIVCSLLQLIQTQWGCRLTIQIIENMACWGVYHQHAVRHYYNREVYIVLVAHCTQENKAVGPDGLKMEKLCYSEIFITVARGAPCCFLQQKGFILCAVAMLHVRPNFHQSERCQAQLCLTLTVTHLLLTFILNVQVLETPGQSGPWNYGYFCNYYA